MEKIFKNIEYGDINWLKNEAKKLKCEYKEIWRSMFNNYLVYVFEPFDSRLFKREAIIEGESNALKFIEMLFKKRRKTIEHLKKCLNIELQNIN